MLRHHGSRLVHSANFQQLYTARFVPLFLHLVILILVFVYRVSYRKGKIVHIFSIDLFVD